MPFIVNLSTQGKTWQEQSIRKSQVIGINETVRRHVPDLYA